ncbi:MAG: RHS repeat-associated core domain-containing protein [Paludibacteraceae bacterium]|nr:RHS repeat-associated core domain-containing protein [Paludibacteraceae bacterium]
MRKKHDNIRLYHVDHLGSTSLVTDIDGEITQHVAYIPYGEVFVEQRNGSWNTPYLFNAKELDEETGLYYYGARYLDPTHATWLSVDPLFEKYVGMTPYNYCMGNPIVFGDPDGKDTIKVSSEGCVSEIIKSDGENVFLDHMGYRLSFHDEKDVDKKRLTENVHGLSYDVGDRVYMNISAEDAVTAICSVPQNEDIKNDFFPFYWDIFKASWDGADFTFSFLIDYYDSHRGKVDLESGKYCNKEIEERARRKRVRIVYDEFIYFRFEGTSQMYNLYDAGNFMWGAWSVEVGISPAASRIGPEVNEILQGRLSGDSEADRKAIKDGRIWWRWKGENVKDK